jgi:vacuolar-type H+-ATPase subunit H
VSSFDRTPRGREIEDSTAARLAEIVAAAEKAARQVIDEAEDEARSRLIDAREEADRIVADRLAGLAELTDEIAAQAEALRRQSEALQRALAEAKVELGGGAESLGGSAIMGRRRDDSDSEERRPTGPALSIVETSADEQPDPEPEPEPASDDRPVAEAAPNGDRNGNGSSPGFSGSSREGATPAGARLLATQMAVSGSSRAEIEARLRNGFAIKDTGAILDAILGPEA